MIRLLLFLSAATALWLFGYAAGRYIAQHRPIPAAYELPVSPPIFRNV